MRSAWDQGSELRLLCSDTDWPFDLGTSLMTWIAVCQVLIAETKIILVLISRGGSADDPRQYLKSNPTGPSTESVSTR